MRFGHSDKRNYMRMKVDSRVEFRCNGSDQSFEALGKDLSSAGLRFTTETPVKVGDILKITVYPGADVTPPLEAVLEVLRVSLDETTRLYEVAGSFTKMS